MRGLALAELDEVGATRLWLRGGYPRAMLSGSLKAAMRWLRGYLSLLIGHMAQPDEAYFWATHAGAELDLLMFKHGLRVGVEFKRVDAPKMTASMHIALQDLKLDALYVVYPGERRYTLMHSDASPTGVPVHAIPLTDLAHIRADWS